MASSADRDVRRGRSIFRESAFAAVFLAVALVLFTWPFVRVPPLALVPASLHVFAAWILVVLGLWRMSRALAPTPAAREEDEDG